MKPRTSLPLSASMATAHHRTPIFHMRSGKQTPVLRLTRQGLHILCHLPSPERHSYKDKHSLKEIVTAWP